MSRYFKSPRILIVPGATYSFVSLYFVKHILVPSVVMCYRLIVSTPIDVSMINKYIVNYGFLGEILAPDLHPGELKFGENQVNGRVSGLHCTWLVPCTRASSDDVDGFLTLRVDPLEEGRSTLRAWPIRYLLGHRIMLYGGRLVEIRRGSKLRLVPGQTW
ncbi:hypothetical protein M9H77_17230 [Catharanthus roseus]|uniref:Uncharacterized protein n=1 Tax=Catharanthus roseus TaxID=4058 RepID=A0ACC0B407_CATRO|nr:hypothetical protein M9H77_17230 [Catharanthus roseus]